MSRATYTPLPTSSPGPASSPSDLYPSPPSNSRYPRPSRRTLCLLFSLTLASFFFAGALIHPEPLQNAVQKGKEAVAGASGAWVWKTASEAEAEAEWQAQPADGAEVNVELDVSEPMQEGKATSEETVTEGKEDASSAHKTADDEVQWTRVGEDEAKVEAEDGVDCSGDVRALLSTPEFWKVEGESTHPLPRDRLPILPRDYPPFSPTCLSQAVFSARLVSLSPDGSPSPIATQTLLSLPAPTLSTSLSTYDLLIPSTPSLPRASFSVEVFLDFGFYVGVIEGVPCGDNERRCNGRKIAQDEGEELRYVGKRVEVVSGGVVELGRDLPATDPLPRCTDLSSLSGFWSNLSYFPSSPACLLVTPSLPLPFVPVSTFPAPASPIWINLVGDSNTRNMFNHLTASLGGGHKIFAPKVTNSPTHNGTHATVAFRYRSGHPSPNEQKGAPDVIVTWAWWYQNAHTVGSQAMTSAERRAEFDAALDANRDDLVKLVDTDFASYLRYTNAASTLSFAPALAAVAANTRPYRTYLSLGSHGEDLSVPGVAASLDALFSPTSGLSRAKRDAANLRLFTTTLVNARYIPPDRFPHQDLLRNNALISAKNAYTASSVRDEFLEEGRMIDVEQLTRGIVDSDEWMKASHGKPDAVHFRGEVYDEWVRVVWTDLVKGTGEAGAETTVGTDEARRRWKRRVSAWAEEPEDEEEEDEPAYGF
ncbi:hypothetical protein Rt10032_c14g5404 [Rhodotorula toruloides]|uniref:Uncharacterized protein n=1 Tax=Rhodotorula toruloides TaxID=5286 RepID=A0A511KM19_RHOTO|nr:hypothetical protein Rt10032_c14g5404 [Rhodotorula toruloides]